MAIIHICNTYIIYDDDGDSTVELCHTGTNMMGFYTVDSTL